jgi:ABC-2 type transport system permease protein
MNVAAYFSFFSIEMRQLFSYRLIFWIRLVAAVVIQVTTTWFLWQSIFKFTGKATIGSMNLEQMMFYYLLVPLISGLTSPEEEGPVSGEIYTGALTKYQIYPLNYFLVSYSRFLASYVFGLMKFLIGFLIYALIWKFPVSFNPSALQIVCFFFFTLLATTLSFSISFCIEICSFWVDVVWNLRVMLRFVVSICGGALLPLTLFSDRAQGFLGLLPFHYLFSFPVRLLTDSLPLQEIFMGWIYLLLWTIFFVGLARMIWRRGQYQYTGVGI